MFDVMHYSAEKKVSVVTAIIWMRLLTAITARILKNCERRTCVVILSHYIDAKYASIPAFDDRKI